MSKGLIGVRDTGVSFASWGPTEIPRTSQHYYNEGFKDGAQWAPIMSKDASL